MFGLFAFLKRVYIANNPPLIEFSTESTPVRFGILGAARIASRALIVPARSHPEVVIHGIAARDLGRAQDFAAQHGIEKVYGGDGAYQQLLDDPEIDVVYNPLPNSLHYEWTMKAFTAGKHVLLEKPAANTVEETKRMFELAQEKGLVLLEAFHYRFHPAINRVKEILDSGEIGNVKSIEHLFTVPEGVFLKPDDIRFNFALGGGSLMDEGCYILSCTRFLTGTEPTSVMSASVITTEADRRVDQTTTAALAFPNDVAVSFTCSLGVPPRWGFIPHLPQNDFRIIGDKGEIFCTSWIVPTFYHYIQVTTNDERGKKIRTEKVYHPKDIAEGPIRDWKGEEWWTTYRYQLEAFVDKVKGRKPATWISAEESIGNMRAIEMIYEKANLPLRPSSQFQPSTL